MIRLERIHMMSQTALLKPLRKFVRKLSTEQSCCDENMKCLVMAINEACMNIMQHAYLGSEDEEIIIEFWKHKDELVVKIFDFAESVDINLIKSRNLEDVRPGGLGVHLINEVMECVEYKHIAGDKGNILEMRKPLNQTDNCKT
jgi:anti-sigma regulatory factor (Ser/Thr protein kinase)